MDTYQFFKRLLFLWPPEQAHQMAMWMMQAAKNLGLKQIISNLSSYHSTDVVYNHWGLQMRNKVGLAAGFDKNGDYIEVLQELGFGHIEVGTITPRPQPGNPKPRLFRLPKDNALINRMGFNNHGVDHLVSNLERFVDRKVVIGGNIGKNKDTANEFAWKDYLACFKKLHHLVDYFTVNVSSPNTPGLRELQTVESLKQIINPLLDFDARAGASKPILIKIDPDSEMPVYEAIVQFINESPVDGIILTNTTVSRSNLITNQQKIASMGMGGLSGKPLKTKSNEVLQSVKKNLYSDKTIIGVGGVFNSIDFMEKVNLGADLVQVYTGFIYQGPAIVSQLLNSSPSSSL